MVKATKNVNIREANIEAILRLLLKVNLSAAQIARELNLSKTAVANILIEMEELNLVENIATNGASLEKYQRSLYQINKEAGAMLIIEFGSVYVNVILSYLNGEAISKVKLDNLEFLTIDSLELIVKEYQELARKVIPNIPVLVCVISAPGQINKDTDDIVKSVKFKHIKDTNVRTWFIEKIKIPVIIKNDINLAIIGEQKIHNTTSSLDNALLLYIDSGIGGAIMNKGKLIDGDDGFAAEFGLIKTYDNFGNHLYYDLICSINSIKTQVLYRKNIGNETIINEEFKYRDVVEAYIKEDELVTEVVTYTAGKIGELISDLYNIFNYKNIFIGGRIKDLGNKYLDSVKASINIDLREINLQYTESDDDAAFYGAVVLGTNYVFKNITSICTTEK